MKSACGGDIVGDWKITGVCYDETALAAQAKQLCADATLKIGDASVTGDVSYKADKSFVQGATELDATAELSLSTSCLGGATCAQLQAQVNMDAADGNEANCVSAAGGGCTCSTTIKDSSKSNGTYSTSGNTVTQTANNATEVQDFCVNGNRLVLLPNKMAAASDLPVRLVLQKK